MASNPAEHGSSASASSSAQTTTEQTQSTTESPDFSSMSIKELKAFLVARGSDAAGCIERADLVAKCTRIAQSTVNSGSADINGNSATEAGIAAGRQLLSGTSGSRSVRVALANGREVEAMAQCSQGDGGDDVDLLVIVLHGFGANHKDLVPLSQQLIQQRGLLNVPRRGSSSGAAQTGSASQSTFQPGRVCFVHPNGIQDLGGGSRAWWNIDMQQLLMHVAMQDAQALFVNPPVGLDEARETILSLIATLRAAANGLPLDRVILAGFSQGAMLAADVALTLGSQDEGGGVGGLIVLSGVGIARDEWAAKAAAICSRAGRPPLRVLQTHGTEDPILPFALGQKLSEFLRSDLRADVDFVSFRGGHTIGVDGVRKIGAFLSALPAQKL